jgi:hypothetical protein
MDWKIYRKSHSPAEGAVGKEEKHLKAYFASDNICLGAYDSPRKVPRGGCAVRKSKTPEVVVCRVQGGGCQECDGSEVWTFIVDKADDGGRPFKLRVSSYVECFCGGGELERCEENDDYWVALPQTPVEEAKENFAAFGAALLRACAVCDARPEKLDRCSRCKVTWYCCRQHQKTDWKRHRKECNAQFSEAATQVERKLLVSDFNQARKRSSKNDVLSQLENIFSANEYNRSWLNKLYLPGSSSLFKKDFPRGKGHELYVCTSADGQESTTADRAEIFFRDTAVSQRLTGCGQASPPPHNSLADKLDCFGHLFVFLDTTELALLSLACKTTRTFVSDVAFRNGEVSLKMDDCLTWKRKLLFRHWQLSTAASDAYVFTDDTSDSDGYYDSDDFDCDDAMTEEAAARHDLRHTKRRLDLTSKGLDAVYVPWLGLLKQAASKDAAPTTLGGLEQLKINGGGRGDTISVQWGEEMWSHVAGMTSAAGGTKKLVLYNMFLPSSVILSSTLAPAWRNLLHFKYTEGYSNPLRELSNDCFAENTLSDAKVVCIVSNAPSLKSFKTWGCNAITGVASVLYLRYLHG